MKIALLDVNMLIAITWPSHIHHQLARNWFEEHARKGWATCPVTEGGFIRISSNQKLIKDAVSPEEARRVLSDFHQTGSHHFWKDEISYAASELPFTFLTGHRQVTDAYLLGLAIYKQGCLVTLDQGIAHLLAKNSPRHQSLCVVR